MKIALLDRKKILIKLSYLFIKNYFGHFAKSAGI